MKILVRYVRTQVNRKKYVMYDCVFGASFNLSFGSFIACLYIKTIVLGVLISVDGMSYVMY